MKHGSLFSGIGGFDLAAEWIGWENKFHCENNSFCQKILKHYWPDAKSYGDITTTDFNVHRGEVDIITGGFPCQPYSQAGKRKGKADDRHLWPQMLRAIREIQPCWVVGENVSGLLNWNRGMVLDEIKADLEAAGFEVFPPLVLPACGKDAPHRRDRLWTVAYSSSNGYKLREPSKDRSQKSENKSDEDKRQWIWNDAWRDGKQGDASNPTINGFKSGTQLSIREKVSITQSNSNRNRGSQWLSEPGICGVADGIPNRVDRIKALGNAIVPQVVFEIFKAIDEIDNL